METLKCLLTCFSQTLYVPPEYARTHRNRWLEHVVCKNGYFTKALFSSLINVVCTYDPIGWGVPYNHLMFRDDHEGVASVALQVLNVLLQYNQHHFHYQIQLQQHQRYLLQQQQQHQQQLQQQQQQQQQLQQSPEQPAAPRSPIQQSRSFQQLHAQTSPFSQQLNGLSLENDSSQPNPPSYPPSPLISPAAASSSSPALNTPPLAEGESSPQRIHAQQLLSHSLQLQHAQQQLLRAQQPATSEQTQNLILAALADMKRNKDFQLIIDTFIRLMANPIVATAARLPYSVKQLEWHHHILMLFWYLVEDNKKFLNYFITSDKCPQLLVPMLCFMYENRKDPSSLGVIQLCTFILLLLSGERDFAVSLNKPIINARLPSDLPRPANSAHYSHFDLLSIVALHLLTDAGSASTTNPSASQHLAPVRECLLTAIANASPFVKGVGMYASVCLVRLYERLADPRVLFASENTCRLVHLLLEIFNNIIQYQFEGNPCLIYAILRSQNEFSKLAHLKIVNPPAILPNSPSVVVPQTPQQQQQQLQEQLQIPHFVPTGDWLEAWKRTLPLDVILRMITMVSPKIQSVCSGSFTAADEQVILTKLENTTLVGLLPAPHPILIRKYQSNDATQTWLLSYLWGSIFLQQSHPPLFFSTKVKLFVLHTS